MSELSSVLVSLDGPSKCGKTTIANEITQGAQLIGEVIDGVCADDFIGKMNLSDEPKERHPRNMQDLRRDNCFTSALAISAGNAFRAAALYRLRLRNQGTEKDQFVPEDAYEIRRLLSDEETVHLLQNDPEIGRSVSEVARLAGIQAVCGTLFAETVRDAYMLDGGGNIVVADARDPIGHLLRNDMIGGDSYQIHPETVISLYIDTPPDVAAERMSGDYNENLNIVQLRRHLDETRDELPAIRPDDLFCDYDEWVRSLNTPWVLDRRPPTLCLDNGRSMALSSTVHLGDRLGHLANDIGLLNRASKTRPVGQV